MAISESGYILKKLNLYNIPSDLLGSVPTSLSMCLVATVLEEHDGSLNVLTCSVFTIPKNQLISGHGVLISHALQLCSFMDEIYA